MYSTKGNKSQAKFHKKLKNFSKVQEERIRSETKKEENAGDPTFDPAI
jgi:hypothetical protein